MKRWLDTPLNRRRLLWGVTAGLAAMVALVLVVAWLNSRSQPAGVPLLVRASVMAATGWSWPVLLGVELALGFGFGVTVGVAVPPMEGSGTAVMVRTAAHLLISSTLFAGICWVCGLPRSNWKGLLLLLGLYWLLYLVIWLLRYLHWRRELEDIRRELGLAEPDAGWRRRQPLAPYLLVAAAMELSLPPLLRLAEQGSDIPVLTGLCYPYLLLPVVCLAVGWGAGQRLGLALALPAACAVLTLPNVFFVYNPSALFQAGVAVAFALAGNLAGALCRHLKKRGERNEDP